MEQKNMENIATLNFINKQTYSREDVLKFYEGANNLLRTEQVLFEKLLPAIKDKKILDIGIGGGRTTAHLLEISNDYTGVDYVTEFVDKTAEKYPNARVLWADATNLEQFADETFDFILFSYNGLDSISNDARLKLMREANRVLKADGVFMFSSHNRDYRYFNKLPWQQKFQFNKGFLIFFLHCLYHLPKHFKMKKHEIYTDDYAIINDGDHRFSLLLYYISIRNQKKQLAEIGFENVEAYDMDGELVESDAESHWIHYLARKNGEQTQLCEQSSVNVRSKKFFSATLLPAFTTFCELLSYHPV